MMVRFSALDMYLVKADIHHHLERLNRKSRCADALECAIRGT